MATLPAVDQPTLKFADDQPIPTLKFQDDPQTLKFQDDPQTLKFQDDPPTLKFQDDPPPTLKFQDDPPPTLKFHDDPPPTLKFRDDPLPTLKFRTIPPTLKFRDDPIPTLKFRDDGPTIKFADDGGRAHLDRAADLEVPGRRQAAAARPAEAPRHRPARLPATRRRPGPLGGGGRGVPFVLSTPHHSMAWTRTFPQAAEAAVAALEQQIGQYEQVLERVRAGGGRGAAGAAGPERRERAPRRVPVAGAGVPAAHRALAVILGVVHPSRRTRAGGDGGAPPAGGPGAAPGPLGVPAAPGPLDAVRGRGPSLPVGVRRERWTGPRELRRRVVAAPAVSRGERIVSRARPTGCSPSTRARRPCRACGMRWTPSGSTTRRATQVAQRKAYQLRVAQDVGLTIPRP